jgi:hypothetical protein
MELGWIAWLGCTRRQAPDNPDDKPKKRHGRGVYHDIKSDAYSGDGVAKKIVFMTISHYDDDSCRP